MCVVSLGKKRELLVRVVFEKTGCEMGEPEGSAARDLLPFTSCCVEFGHSLGALGDGVLGELAGEDEADGRLDLARTKSLRLREAADVGGLVADALNILIPHNPAERAVKFTTPDLAPLRSSPPQGKRHELLLG